MVIQCKRSVGFLLVSRGTHFVFYVMMMMVKSTDIFCSNDLYKRGVFEVYFVIFISINPIFFCLLI